MAVEYCIYTNPIAHGSNLQDSCSNNWATKQVVADVKW